MAENTIYKQTHARYFSNMQTAEFGNNEEEQKFRDRQFDILSFKEDKEQTKQAEEILY